MLPSKTFENSVKYIVKNEIVIQSNKKDIVSQKHIKEKPNKLYKRFIQLHCSPEGLAPTVSGVQITSLI